MKESFQERKELLHNSIERAIKKFDELIDLLDEVMDDEDKLHGKETKRYLGFMAISDKVFADRTKLQVELYDVENDEAPMPKYMTERREE